MGLLDKIKQKLNAGEELSEELLNEGLDQGIFKPGLRFSNSRSAEGPHVVEFDGAQITPQGEMILFMDLRGSLATPPACERLLLLLDAIEQNKGALCCILMTDDDYQAFDEMLNAAQESHPGAVQRIQIALPNA